MQNVRVAAGSRVTRWRSREQEVSNSETIANRISNGTFRMASCEMRWFPSNNAAVAIPAREGPGPGDWRDLPRSRVAGLSHYQPRLFLGRFGGVSEEGRRGRERARLDDLPRLKARRLLVWMTAIAALSWGMFPRVVIADLLPSAPLPPERSLWVSFEILPAEPGKPLPEALRQIE